VRPQFSRLVFLLLIISIWIGMHYFIWLRLAHDTGLPSEAQAGVALLLAVLAPLPLLSILRLIPRRFAQPAWTIAFVWAGSIFLLNASLAVGDVVQAVARHAGASHDPVWVARVVGLGALLVALGLAATGWMGAHGEVAVKRVEVRLEKLPQALDGFSIVQVSDLHVSPDTDVKRVRRIVETVNAEQPDLIALTGDLVDGLPETLQAGVAPLAELRARHGAFFVTGNHEYYSGADRWLQTFRKLGMRTLQNERVQIDQASASFDLAGVPDWTGGAFGPTHRPRLADVLRGRDESRALVLLAHQPRQFPEAAKLGVGLQISGHTHGGQIWPFTWLIHVAERRVAGLHRESGSQLYVSRGTGFWGPPMRLSAPPEITRITLRAA
jgi:predicted MPP superfamily phosphohydrolase